MIPISFSIDEYCTLFQVYRGSPDTQGSQVTKDTFHVQVSDAGIAIRILTAEVLIMSHHVTVSADGSGPRRLCIMTAPSMLCLKGDSGILQFKIIVMLVTLRDSVSL